jgi:radical SAM protein with 4Fe4S-binding SPASM domain
MKIDFNKLNQQQKSNLESALKAYNDKRLISSPSPSVLYIELTQNCFGRCVFCHGKNWVNDPKYDMSDKVFDTLLRDYIPFAVLIDLRGWGESLSLPNFDEYINKVTKFGPKIRLTTTLGCGSIKALQSLIDNDVFVSVSFDYADKAMYQSMRRGLSYDTVIKNMEFLTNEMRKKGTLQDNIRLGIAPLQKANLDHVEKIIRIAEHYGIREIVLSQLVASRMDYRLLKYNKRKTIAVLQKAVKLSREAGIRLQLARSPFEELYIKDKTFDRCCHPWLYVFVDYKGNVLFCDHMLGTRFIKYSIGCVTERKEDVWNGQRAQAQRLRHIQKDIKTLPSKCITCYKEGRYADHEHEIDKQFEKWLVTENDIEKKLS